MLEYHLLNNTGGNEKITERDEQLRALTKKYASCCQLFKCRVPHQGVGFFYRFEIRSIDKEGQIIEELKAIRMTNLDPYDSDVYEYSRDLLRVDDKEPPGAQKESVK